MQHIVELGVIKVYFPPNETVRSLFWYETAERSVSSCTNLRVNKLLLKRFYFVVSNTIKSLPGIILFDLILNIFESNEIHHLLALKFRKIQRSSNRIV